MWFDRWINCLWIAVHWYTGVGGVWEAVAPSPSVQLILQGLSHPASLRPPRPTVQGQRSGNPLDGGFFVVPLRYVSLRNIFDTKTQAVSQVPPKARPRSMSVESYVPNLCAHGKLFYECGDCMRRSYPLAAEKKVYAICKFVNRPGPCSEHVYEPGEVCCGWHRLVKPNSCRA